MAFVFVCDVIETPSLVKERCNALMGYIFLHDFPEINQFGV